MKTKPIIIAVAALVVLGVGGLFGYAYFKNHNFDVVALLMSAKNSLMPGAADEPVKDEPQGGEAATATGSEDARQEIAAISGQYKEENVARATSSCIGRGEIISADTIREGGSATCCLGLSLVLDKPDSFNKAYCLNCGNDVCEPPEDYYGQV